MLKPVNLLTGKNIAFYPLNGQILGWPKSSFGFSIGAYGKTGMKFLANPVVWYVNYISIKLKTKKKKIEFKLSSFFF